MRRIVGVLLILWGLGWLASQIPATPDRQPPPSSWRRTCDGWERADWLSGDLSPRSPALHPVVVGLVLLLFASAGLVGFAPDEHTPGDI